MLGLVIAPLLVDRLVFFPYISAKSLFLRLILSLVLVLGAVYYWYSRSFRGQILEKIRRFFKNPLVVSVSVFALIFLVSTIFAFFPYRAFFGNVERAEGFIGMFYFVAVFFSALVLFEKKEWEWFFWGLAGVSVVLFFDGVRELFAGSSRPASFLGNPIYLAQLFLFSFVASLALFWYRRAQGIRFLAVGLAALSLVGILITQTRGVIAGVVAGVACVALWLAFRYRSKNAAIRNSALILLGIVVLFGAIFVATKSSSAWKRIPGLDRLSEFSLQDRTLQTRLISLGVSWNAINPTHEGWGRFLIGWGPDNFGIAYNKYYDPEYYRYESAWFDRAHNKLMDVLVMNGVVGLLSYIALWGALLWVVFKRWKDATFLRGAMLFFAVAYFVQNLFVFDSITTFPFFFAFLAFIVYESSSHAHPQEPQKKKGIFLGAGLSLAALFAVVAAVFWTIVPYAQMRAELSLVRDGDISGLVRELPSIFTPYTYAQENIRTMLLSGVRDIYNPENEKIQALSDMTFSAFEEYIQKEPFDPRSFIVLAQAYSVVGDKTGDSLYYQNAHDALERAVSLAPNRQDARYLLGYNLAQQGQFEAALAVLEDTAALNTPPLPSSLYYLGTVEVASENTALYKDALDHFEGVFIDVARKQEFYNESTLRSYWSMMQYFKSIRDKERFIVAAERLKDMTGEAELGKTIESARNGRWDLIELE